MIHNTRPAAPNAATFATLREIEGRLKSIRNIEKITNTMKIVASTKLTRAQRAMTASRQYGETSNEVFEQAETKALEGDKKSLIIVASSDKGLCGGIHSGLTRHVRKLLLEKPNTDLVILGEKCKAQLGRSNANNIVLSFAGVGKDIPTFSDAQSIADQITSLPTEYDDIEIVYNKFLNAQSYEASQIPAYSEAAIINSRKFDAHSLQENNSNSPILANYTAYEIDDEVLVNLREYGLANSLYWLSPKAMPANNLLAETLWT